MASTNPRMRLSADAVEVTVNGDHVQLELLGGGRPPSLRLPVQNLSRHGMFLRSDWFIAKDKTFPFSLRVDTEAPIHGTAVVRWVRQVTAGPLQPSGFGVEITTFDDNDEARYLRYIEERLLHLRVADLMSDRILTVAPSDSVGTAVRVMRQANVGAIVVCDRDGALCGIFTERDVLRVAGEPERLKEAISTQMTASVVTACREDSAETAFRKLVSGKFRHLPVVQDGRVIAMVSVRDLLPYWSELMDIQASRLNREHGRALGLIVHDLRSPITVIESMVQLMHDPSSGVADFLSLDGPAVVHQTCEKMLTLIDDLLDVSHIATGTMRLQQRTIDLADILRQAQTRFAVQAARKGLTLLCDDLPTSFPHVADPVRLGQVLDNLVSNAIKYTHRGGEIRIGLQAEADGCRISVADTGQGMNDDDLATIFEEWGRASAVPTAGERSSGLGLAIVKKIVDAHGGRVDVRSKVDAGTTFEVVLAN